MASEQTTGTKAGPDNDHIVGTARELIERARNAFENNDLSGSENILRQLTAQQPNIAPAWHLLGVVAARAGALDQAAACFARATTLSPDTALYCADLGESLDRLNRPGDAASAWAQAVRSAPDEPEYLSRLARSLLAAGAVEDALRQHETLLRTHGGDIGLRLQFARALMRARRYRLAAAELDAILHVSSACAKARLALAACRHRLGELDDAIGLYRAAIETDPAGLDTRASLAAVLRDRGNAAEALRVADGVLERQPGHAHARNNRALALCDLGRHGDAVDALERAVAGDPANLDIRHNLAVALHATGRYDEGEGILRDILRARTRWPEAWQSLGNLLRETERFEEAEACYRHVLEARPFDFKTYGGLGLALMNQNKADAAIAVYEKALALKPDQPDIRMSLGIAQLLGGDYRNGWANYEARWNVAAFAGPPRDACLPMWDGASPGRILLRAEQGFGDTLQFCRYAPIVAGAANPVVLECQRPLRPLMHASFSSRLDGAITIIAHDDPRPPADAYAPLLSLPHILGTTLATIPAHVPYLAADPAATARWRQRFDTGRPAVGLVWAGNPARQDDRMRSCPAAALAPILAVPGAAFYSLQKDACDATPAGLDNLAPDLNDFADTAAAIAAMDLVIAVDTAVAHLAGGLGKPVWVLLGQSADWRYLIGRDDSPWYPTMRLFRRTGGESWLAICERVADRLTTHIDNGRPW